MKPVILTLFLWGLNSRTHTRLRSWTESVIWRWSDVSSFTVSADPQRPEERLKRQKIEYEVRSWTSDPWLWTSETTAVKWPLWCPDDPCFLQYRFHVLMMMNRVILVSLFKAHACLLDSEDPDRFIQNGSSGNKRILNLPQRTTQREK